MNLTELICDLTLPCADNGRDFTRTDRIHRIRDLLRSTPYTCLGERPLAQVWQHPDFDPALPLVLVSSHIDSLYTNYHASCNNGTLLGTFDNSVTNAVILSLIMENRLPRQVLVAFTGDEENDSRGADQVMDILQSTSPNPIHPGMVVVLDITEESYENHSFTFENLFRASKASLSVPLRFEKKRDLAQFLRDLLAPSDPIIIKEGDPDESWQYDEHDLNCFAFCLPCKTITGDMHDDEGVYVKESAAHQYANTLAEVLALMLGHPHMKPRGWTF